MSVVNFTLPTSQSFNINGDPIVGAQLWFTLEDTNTPITIYSDVNLSTPLTNPMVANSAGRFPPIYFDNTNPIRVRVFAPDADVSNSTPLEEYNPFINASLSNEDIIAINSAVSDAQLARDGAVAAEQGAVAQVTLAANQVALATDQVALASVEATNAATDADRAELARDSTIVDTNVYVDIATGRAAVADGETFLVEAANGGIADLHRRTDANNSVFINSYASQNDLAAAIAEIAVFDSRVALLENSDLSLLVSKNTKQLIDHSNRLEFLESEYSTGGWVTDAYINEEGWTIDLAMDAARAGGIFDYTKIFITVYDDGFIDGQPCHNIPRQIGVSSIVYKETPRQDEFEIETIGGNVIYEIALDQQVFNSSGRLPKLSLQYGFYRDAGDVAADGQIIIASANNSIEPYHAPFGKHATAPKRLIDENEVFEFVADGLGQRDGRTVDTAMCVITGVTSGHVVEIPVREITVSTLYPNRGLAVPCYAAQPVLNGFEQGEELQVDWRIYPFIGDAIYDTANGVDADGDAVTQSHICNKDGTYPIVYAYIDNVNGDDVTGVASNDPAVAKANPFTNQRTAAFATQAYNNEVNGHNDLGGARTRFFRGQDHVLNLGREGFGGPTNFGARDANVSNAWYVYEPDPDGVGDCRIVSDNTNLNECYPRGTEFNGFTEFLVTDANWGIHGRSDPVGGNFRQETRFVNTVISDSGDSSNNAIIFNSTGDTYIENIESDAESNNFLDGFGGGPYDLKLLRSSRFTDCENIQPQAMLGVEITNIEGGVTFVSAALTNKIPNKQPFIWGCRIQRNGVNTDSIQLDSPLCQYGYSMLNVLVESVNSVQALIRTSTLNVNSNMCWHHNVTTIGERWLANYEDTFTMTGAGQLKKNSGFINCIIWEPDYKDGSFQNVVGRTHTKNQGYFVGSRNVSTLIPSSNGQTGPGPNSWYGRAWPNSFNYVGADVNGVFVNYTASSHFPINAGGSVGGDYRPLSTSTLLLGVKPHELTVPFDIEGNPRLQNGNAARGAYEAAV